MIIFDLDDCLADCEHRRHFVDREHPDNFIKMYKDILTETNSDPSPHTWWKPDWKAFYEACDKDSVIEPVMTTFSRFWIGEKPCHVEIWTGRCESTREKTLNWFLDNWFLGIFNHEIATLNKIIKMRPIGNTDELWDLKQQWYLDLAVSDGKDVDFVFDSDPESIEMWRRRNIFVFDVKQTRKEF